MKKVLLSIALLTGSASAAEFEKGPLLKDYGPHAAVEHNHQVSVDTRFKVAFDVAEQAEPGEVNRKFVSLARFLNMHVANGVKPENIQLALVVHGKAGWDLTNEKVYQAKFSASNQNLALLKALADQGVQISLCGQSAAYHGIEAGMLAPQVNLALSAMTAHALLQQQGYTVNPF